MKIAVIGSGIAGLTCARLLSPGNDLTVFEANDYIGGHTNTIAVREGRRRLPVDTGFIVFNRRNYPNLCRLFDLLEVEQRDSDMSFSVKCEQSGLEYNGTTLCKLFSQKRNMINVRFLAMLKDILLFHKQGSKALGNGLDDTTTVADFVAQQAYSEYFLEKYLIPLGASLWSCPPQRFKSFPIRFVLEFLHNHGMLQLQDRPVWKTLVGGSSSYIKKMIAPFSERILLRSKVKQLIRNRSDVTVVLTNGNSDQFDEVIIACHADQGLDMLANADRFEDEVLRQFEYQFNEAILHTDTGLLPKNHRAWASWNYRIAKDQAEHTQVTYNMSMLQGLSAENTYCVSLNQTHAIAPDKIIRRLGYHHPVFKPGRNTLQQAHERLIRRDRISWCGAYWGYGFHEDGMSSGLRVCAAFGRELG